MHDGWFNLNEELIIMMMVIAINYTFGSIRERYNIYIQWENYYVIYVEHKDLWICKIFIGD